MMMKYTSITPWKMVFAFLVLLSGQAFAADRETNSADTGDSTFTQQINRAMSDLKFSLEMKNFPAALNEAHQVVSLLGSGNGEPSKNHAVALLNLAKVQQVMGFHLKSETSYQKSIQIMERHQGVYAQELLTLLNNLGMLYYDSSDYDLALESFRRAQHITHRNEGVYSLGQLQFVDWITLLNIKTANTKNADTQQRFYYSINVKNYGEDNPRMLPAMNKMADWFSASGQLKEALQTYEKALVVIEKYQLAEVEKLHPLRGLSTVIYLKGSCCMAEPLAEALQIVTTNADSDHVDEVDALVHLADMHMIRNKRSEAKKYYQQAWNRLGRRNPLTVKLFSTPELLGVSRIEDVYEAYHRTVEGRSQMGKTIYRAQNSEQASFQFAFGAERKTPQTAVIGEPLSLCHSQALELAHTRDSQDLEQYFVDVNFTVTSEGGVRNVSLLDSNAPTRLQRYVTNTLRHARYRPTLKEGEAVETNNIKLRQTFSQHSSTLNLQTPFNRTSADGRRAISLGCQLLAIRG